MKEIALTLGKVALVDDDDFEFLSLHKWHTQMTKIGSCVKWYAVRGRPKADRGPGKPAAILMHREILAAAESQQVDHKNGDGLDNRRENIRLCNPSQNQSNRKFSIGPSGYRGVRRQPGGGMAWEARISINNKSIRIGSSKDPAAAARLYDKRALELFGEFAVLNFPEMKQATAEAAA